MTTETANAGSAYGFDNSTPDAADQVDLLAGILDQHTFGVLEGLGLPIGARCADLGAGRGTVALWLAEQVGPDGHVLVIDTDPRHVPAHPRITVRTGDVAALELEPDSFDVIHERLLLMHVARREEVVRRQAAALKPGGALVVSDWATDHLEDMFAAGPADIRQLFLTFQHAFVRSLEQGSGMDSTWARRVPDVMASAGLVDITSVTFNQLWRGGEPGMLLHASNSRQKQDLLRAAGMTDAQLDQLREAMNNPDVMARSWPMHTTVGFRPAA